MTLMRTKLELKDGRYVVEIPKTIIDLYSLKAGMFFQLKALEKNPGICVINLAIEIPNNH